MNVFVIVLVATLVITVITTCVIIWYNTLDAIDIGDLGEYSFGEPHDDTDCKCKTDLFNPETPTEETVNDEKDQM